MKTIFLIILILLFSGCCPLLEIRPLVLGTGQAIRYQNDNQIIQSNKKFSTVCMSSLQDKIEFTMTPEFQLYISNNSNQTLNFSYNNINAYCGNNQLQILTYQEALDDYYKKQNKFLGLTVDQYLALEQMRLQTNYYAIKYQNDIQYTSMLFKRQSIPPNHYYEGIFKIKGINYSCCNNDLIIYINDIQESHKFIFELKN